MSPARQPGRLAARRVVLWTAAIVGLSLIIMAWASVRAFEASIAPEMEKRTQLIGSTVREEIQRALDFGVPLEAIGGASKYIDRILHDFPEIERVTLLSVNDEIIASSSRHGEEAIARPDRNQVSLPMLRRNTLVGELRLETDPKFVSTRLRGVMLDILVFGLVAVLLAFELVILVSATALGKPLDRVFHLLEEQESGVFSHVIPPTEAGNLRLVARRLSDRAVDLAGRAGISNRLSALPQAYFADIRLPIFIFSTATEISGAFLPLYARDLDAPEWMAPEMAATAPLVAYLIAMAVAAPLGGKIAQRFSPRRLFLAAIPLTAIALIGVGMGQSVIAISFWHGSMALVYAFATIACQEYAIRTAPKSEIAQAIGGYLFVILGGAFCGAALGGVLADRLGPSNAFFVGAGLVVISGLIGARIVSATIGKAPKREEQPVAKPASARTVYRSPRFIALVFGVSVPTNIGMSVFIWYLTPVVLAAQGVSIADIGRVVMLYYLAQVLIGPTVARLADGRVGNVPLLILGITISGLSITSLTIWGGFWPMVVVVTLFGFGHAMCDATQYAQAIRIGEESGLVGGAEAALGGLRLIERLAAIAGLVASVVLVERFGYDTAIGALGVTMLSGSILMLLSSRRSGKTQSYTG